MITDPSWELELVFKSSLKILSPDPVVGELWGDWLLMGAWVDQSGKLKGYKAKCSCGYIQEIVDVGQIKYKRSTKCKQCVIDSIALKAIIPMNVLAKRLKSSNLNKGYQYPYLEKELKNFRVYRKNKEAITVICPVYGEFKGRLCDIVAGKVHPKFAINCIDFATEAILYYIYISSLDVYKIGITNKLKTKHRFRQHKSLIRVIREWKFSICREAYEIEQEIIKEFYRDRFIGPKSNVFGIKELFTKDILNLDYERIKDENK